MPHPLARREQLVSPGFRVYNRGIEEVRAFRRRTIVGSLKEFLARQAETLPTQASAAAKKRDEWAAAVDRLTVQMRDWLQQADAAHVLSIEDLPFSIREEGIGAYEVHGLAIRLGPREVRVEPVARFVAGPLSMTGRAFIPRAFGRVDLTDGLRKFILFRVEKEPTDRWNIVTPDGYEIRPFDQSSFEAALQSLLE
jgi:hypothetical protein